MKPVPGINPSIQELNLFEIWFLTLSSLIPAYTLYVPVHIKAIEKCFTLPYIVVHLTFSKWTIDLVYQVSDRSKFLFNLELIEVFFRISLSESSSLVVFQHHSSDLLLRNVLIFLKRKLETNPEKETVTSLAGGPQY